LYFFRDWPIIVKLAPSVSVTENRKVTVGTT